ncbi:hypothetical protein P879_02051 [Paragonimus westermani]|uniref:F-box domain-containing protein n=1 Tax=Paragonimus westermani TaxID=34504 RepID=A0A8T0DV32_9TREM|nr:hypothetical protein P879_02051 [Paragonimus westermani]
MPFLSPDWRFPGDRWLRSSECGSLWENAKIYRLRMFERMNEMVVKRVCRRSLIEEDHPSWNYVTDFFKLVIYEPHVHLKSGTVREIIQLLLADHFHKLTGRLQLFLIELLRTILVQDDLVCNLERNKYDHIGSAVLWQSHFKAVEEMCAQLDGFDIGQKLTVVAQKRRTEPISASECSASANDDLTLEQLPTECLSRVLSFVNCPKDLETASVASEAIASLVEEDHLWRSLTLANFDMNQVSAVHFGRAGWRNEPPATMKDCNWRRAYLRLLKRYGDQHFYTAKLAVCEVCFCLFWPLFGHPCHYPQKEPRIRLLSPEEFVALFQI